MQYYSPIHNFSTDVDHYEFSKYLFVKSKSLSNFNIQNDYFLSTYDKFQISDSSYWLIINEKLPKYIKSSEVYNIFLLSVWTLSPTETHLKYKLKINDEVTLFLDRFLYNETDIRKTKYTTVDLEEIKEYFKSYLKIFKKKRRLLLALDSTYRACTTYSWKVSFLLYTNALEAILTYSRNPGITNRLAKSYACFMETDKKIRDRFYKEFRNVYNIRSEIVHGTYRIRKRKSYYKDLSSVETLVRKLWQKILINDNYLKEFEKDDNSRDNYLNINFIKSYLPPKIL